MDDPINILKGGLAGGLMTVVGMIIYDKIVPSQEQRLRRVKKEYALTTVAMDVDPELIRAFVNLRYFESHDANAWKIALGRVDSVCMIYKRLATNTQLQPMVYDYSVAWLHYNAASDHLRRLYMAVRSTEQESYDRREAARIKLSQAGGSRRKDRSRGRTAEELEREKEDQKSIHIKLQCDVVQSHIALIMQQTEAKINFIKQRFDQHLSASAPATDDGDDNEEEEEEDDDETQ